jgi:hypothetical protein
VREAVLSLRVVERSCCLACILALCVVRRTLKACATGCQVPDSTCWTWNIKCIVNGYLEASTVTLSDSSKGRAACDAYIHGGLGIVARFIVPYQ